MKGGLKMKDYTKLIIFFILTICIFSFAIALVLASNPFLLEVKWNLCDSANKTKANCDIYWEEFVDYAGIKTDNTTDLNWSQIDEKFKPYYNKTEIYNKTELDNLIKSLNETINNKTVNISMTDYINKTTFDNWSVSFRDSFSENFAEKIDVDRLKEEVFGSGDGVNDNTIIIIVAIAIFGIVAFVIFNKYQQNNSARLPTQTKQSFRKIQPRQEMQEEIKEETEQESLKREIEELKKAVKEKK